MVKKKGTHLVLSGKVCGREEKRFDGECGNFPKGLCCSQLFWSAVLHWLCGADHMHLCTGGMVQITWAYVKNFKKCYVSII